MVLIVVVRIVQGALRILDRFRQQDKPVMYAAVEGGGTTWRAMISMGSLDNVIERKTFKTTTPEKTLTAIREFIDQYPYQSLGVASFGPVDLRRDSDQYGFITSTPKDGWKDTDVLKYLWNKRVPCLFDTDVNAPALAEFMAKGKQLGHRSCAYITVGTGVGVGLVVNGETVHGLMHPEAGHVLFRRHPNDNFTGNCPAHGDCVEGIAASGSLARRNGLKDVDHVKNIKLDDSAWDYAAHALGTLCANLLLVVSPERIVISGGIMNNPNLLGEIRRYCLEVLNSYIAIDQLLEHSEEIIVSSTWGNDAGIVGALTLSKLAYEQQSF